MRALTPFYVALACLALPSAAIAATAPPAVSTGGATAVTKTSAKLHGVIHARGRATTYAFEYGTSTSYGSHTERQSAGNGTAAVRVEQAIDKLSPNTTYHYRLVASSDAGTTNGTDRTFSTAAGAPSVSLSASPQKVTWGFGTFLTGKLSGAHIANRPVILQQRSFPFTGHFSSVGTAKFTDTNGAFGFGISSLLTPMQYRVETRDKPVGVSPAVTVQVAVRVRTNISNRHPKRHHRVFFSGTVSPAHDGVKFAVQRRRFGLWTTIAGGTLAHNDGTSSQFTKRVKINRTAYYRVYVQAAGQGFQPNVGRKIHIIVH